jgi:glycosyltransferase involved in cell wall biosynthesis
MADLVVIMSVYKNDKLEFVIESVQSILHQTFTDFEYYIIFDGPVSSGIDNYISSLGDKRITLFRRDKNEGLAVALNFLLVHILKNPQYRYIARMDADDISLPTRFEKQRAFLLENTEISIVGSWYEEIDESGKHLSDRKLPVDHDSLRKRYMTRTPFAHPSVMYRRQLIEKAGFYPTDTILMEDNVLWGRALKEGLRFANIPQYLLKFRVTQSFYQRRGGDKYCKSYFNNRVKLLKILNAPIIYFIALYLIIFIKMLPIVFLKITYLICRKCFIF